MTAQALALALSLLLFGAGSVALVDCAEGLDVPLGLATPIFACPEHGGWRVYSGHAPSGARGCAPAVVTDR